MSNIKAAVAAIKAELKLAQDGLKFYQARVASLENTLANLNVIEQPVAAPTKKGRAQATSVKTAKPGRGKVGRGGSLPATGKEFWPRLLTAEPMSSAEIYAVAVEALGIRPDKDQAKKLGQRQANALSVLTKAGIVSSTGTGRDRRYFV